MYGRGGEGGGTMLDEELASIDCPYTAQIIRELVFIMFDQE